MDEVFDKDLQALMGDRYVVERPPVAQYRKVDATEEESTEEAVDIWGMVKFPLLFMILAIFLAWTENRELVDHIVAMPGMCLCCICFGWSIKK